MARATTGRRAAESRAGGTRSQREHPETKGIEEEPRRGHEEGELPESDRAPLPTFDEEQESQERQPGSVTETLKRAMAAGLGAVFVKEEGLRSYVKDIKLPKEMMSYLLSQAERSKGELVRIVEEELRRLFASDSFRRELVTMLSELTFEVHAEVKLKPDGPKVERTEARLTKRGRSK